MANQMQAPEQIPIPRLLIGLGCFALIIAVAVGAATSPGSNIQKYVACAALLSIVAGVIGSIVQRRVSRGH